MTTTLWTATLSWPSPRDSPSRLSWKAQLPRRNLHRRSRLRPAQDQAPPIWRNILKISSIVRLPPTSVSLNVTLMSRSPLLLPRTRAANRWEREGSTIVVRSRAQERSLRCSGFPTLRWLTMSLPWSSWPAQSSGSDRKLAPPRLSIPSSKESCWYCTVYTHYNNRFSAKYSFSSSLKLITTNAEKYHLR